MLQLECLNLWMSMLKCRNEILSELDPNFLPAKNRKLQWLVLLVMKRQRSKDTCLRAFGRDLTEIAKGEMDPVVGRENEIRRTLKFV